MESFETRIKSAKQLINDSTDEPFDQAITLWKAGYSLRVIQEVTNIHRSKLSRYINENNLAKDDDVRNQNRQYRINQASKLHKMGFSKEEIAHEMNLNLRTPLKLVIGWLSKVRLEPQEFMDRQEVI